jgi:hypothetical protein
MFCVRRKFKLRRRSFGEMPSEASVEVCRLRPGWSPDWSRTQKQQSYGNGRKDEVSKSSHAQNSCVPMS